MAAGNSRTRVVITGMSAITALGMTEEALWASMLAGRTGIGRLQAFDSAPYKTRCAAEVDREPLGVALKSLDLKAADPTADMALVTAGDALAQAGLRSAQPGRDKQRVGVIVGSGNGCTHNVVAAYDGFFQRGTRGMRPTTVPRSMANAISSRISMTFGLTGPNYVVVSACGSSSIAIGTGLRMIRDGYARQVLCGGAESMLEPASFAAWDNLGVMSRIPEAKKACRPFDVDREGLILGEGAAMLVLESLESAREREATIRAEVLGYGESSDATHMTRPDAEGQAEAMRRALADAGRKPHDVGFINAHGTGTKASDPCECQAVRRVFGAKADDVPCVSTKPFVGHLLGASGAVETIVTILSLEHGMLPPNLNLESPDPSCDVRLAGMTPHPIDARVAMNNSFGFGGNNAVLLVGSPPAD